MDRILQYIYIGVIAVLSFWLYSTSKNLNSLETDLKNARIESLQKTIDLQNQMSEIESQKDEQISKNKIIIDDLRKRISTSRVYIKNDNRQPSSSTSKAQENGCELSQDTARKFIDIAEKGDRAIINLNFCIDSYNALRDKFNKRN